MAEKKFSNNTAFPVVTNPTGASQVVGLHNGNNAKFSFDTITGYVDANAQLEGTDQVDGLDDALAEKLPLSGGTMTGDLLLNVDATDPMQAVTFQQLSDATQNSTFYGEMYFTGNTTPTAIATLSTPVKVTGTYISGDLTGFTHSGGTLTYTDTVSREMFVIATLTATYNGSSNDTSFFIAKSGSVIAKSKQSTFIGGVTPATQPATSKAQITLVEGDTLELWVQNDTGTDDIIVQDVNFSANTIGGSSAVTPSSPELVPFTFSLDSGNTSGADTVTGVCGSCMQSGDYVMGNFTLSFRATSLMPEVALHMPFVVGTFPISIRASVAGNVTMDSGANNANGLGFSSNLASTDSIVFPMKVASSTAPNNYYTLNASFSYKYQNF
jgi:hypothetical protein